MTNPDYREQIKILLPEFGILVYIGNQGVASVQELGEFTLKSKSTLYRYLDRFVDDGLLERVVNNPKVIKNAHYVYRSTPKLKLTLEIVLHWLSSLTLKDNQVELTDPLTFEFMNEITSFFSDVIFPEVKEWTMSKWENHSDPQLFFGDLRAKILNLVELRLENIIFKKLIKNKSNVAEKT
ncbi:hypothetical protein LCGC14_1074500 [marine sediment metagenome]|uniref:HTH marR-type domain-containing protein n=1 Tax=marine sediment metagenome TaxID=412755 RepID=A0A0F9N4G5_9ZZZZ